jgi:hypothetical protein
MRVDITTSEHQFLIELFEATERELIQGIDHAQYSREYREKLKKRLDVLAELRKKLVESAAA